jgi:hypothetical protein
MVDKLHAEHLDVVIGSRFLDERTEVARLRRVVLKTAAFYTRWTSGGVWCSSRPDAVSHAAEFNEPYSAFHKTSCQQALAGICGHLQIW